jgi:hypothetical protein
LGLLLACEDANPIVMISLNKKNEKPAQQSSGEQKNLLLKVKSAIVCGLKQKRWSIDWAKAFDFKETKESSI